MTRGALATVVALTITGWTPVRMASQAHDYGNGTTVVTYADLQRTSEQLAAAREATARFQNVRLAEAAGYRAIGPSVPGLGLHYVRGGTPDRFSVTEPPVLLYERDSAAAGGLRLVGVMYLLIAPTGPDGQPEAPPFPKALASWRHA